MFFVAIQENDQLMAHVPVSGTRGTLGRAPSNDIVVVRAQVSFKHLQIILGPQGFELVDLGSTNGTWVNGVRVTAPTVVGTGDRIRIAQLSIELSREPFTAANGYFNLLQAHEPAVDRTTTSELPLDGLDDPSKSKPR